MNQLAVFSWTPRSPLLSPGPDKTGMEKSRQGSPRPSVSRPQPDVPQHASVHPIDERAFWEQYDWDIATSTALIRPLSSATPNRRTRTGPSEQKRQGAYFVYTQEERLPRGDVRMVQDAFDNADVPIWNAFDFRQITRVSKVVRSLARSRDGIEKTFGPVGSKERNLFLSDWQSMRSLVGRMEGLRFHSPAGKKLFSGMLARFKGEVVQAYVVKDERGNPGAGLPVLVAEAERRRGRHRDAVSLVRPTTMDAEIKTAVLKLQKARCRESRIVQLIKHAATKLRFPMSGSLSDKALTLRIKRILSKPA